jgi:signal transduction histidine kinase
VALELAVARVEQEQARLTSERERIATDLHDQVIQRLFGTGLALHGVVARLGPGAAADRLTEVIDDLDDTIVQIRASVFALHRAGGSAAGMRSRILEVVTEAAPALGFTPTLRLSGPIDRLFADEAGGTPIVNEAVAVLREALTTVARHARATRVEVDVVGLDADDPDSVGAAGSGRVPVLVLVVRDDGVGPGATARGGGLAALCGRAERLGGTLTLSAGEPAGTVLTWTVPLRRE